MSAQAHAGENIGGTPTQALLVELKCELRGLDPARAHQAARHISGRECLGLLHRRTVGAPFVNATTREVGLDFSMRINSYLETPIPVLYKER
jgi:hypothetical protein